MLASKTAKLPLLGVSETIVHSGRSSFVNARRNADN